MTTRIAYGRRNDRLHGIRVRRILLLGGNQMIKSFGDTTTSDLFNGIQSKGVRHLPHTIVKAALNKFDLLNAAHDIKDLSSPPGNRLEAMKGDLDGFHSIRVNDQWRLVFRWQAPDAFDVRLIDYH